MGNERKKKIYSLKESERRGKISEEIAEERLKRLDYVNRTIRCPTGSNYDLNGCDIKATFSMKEFSQMIGGHPSITNCNVQVKSSMSGVAEFTEQFGDNYIESRLELARQKIVVLSARSPELSFNQEFKKQVKFINRFHEDK